MTLTSRLRLSLWLTTDFSEEPSAPLRRPNLWSRALARIATPMMLCQNRLSGCCERRGCGLRAFRENKGFSGAGRGVHGRARLPERGDVPRGAGSVGEPVVRAQGHGGAQGRGEGEGAVEPLPARFGTRRRPHQPGVRTPV